MPPDTLAMMSEHEAAAEERIAAEFAQLTAAEGMTDRVTFHAEAGHSRFTETLFGGATKHVVAGARFPVLMAH